MSENESWKHEFIVLKEGFKYFAPPPNTRSINIINHLLKLLDYQYLIMIKSQFWTILVGWFGWTTRFPSNKSGAALVALDLEF